MAFETEVAIIGAGPYGLSAAAHLGARGVDVRVFGEPMSFWARCMPEGLVLRSPWEASQLSDPRDSFTLEGYQRSFGIQLATPIPVEHFVSYGRWFQSQAVPQVDRHQVSLIDKTGSVFRVLLQDGTELRARRVVAAAGIAPFANRPAELVHLPAEVASHSADLRTPRKFCGQQVVVIGGGQSALESAALLHEAGATVEVLVREPLIYWTWQRPRLHTFRPVGALLYAWPDVGPAMVSHLIARPSIYRRLPRRLQDRWAARALRPTGAGWLKNRLNKVRISTSLAVISASLKGNRVKLKLTDGTSREIDHVVMATGYKLKLENYTFLSAKVLDAVCRVRNHPQLSGGFESSLAGLYFLGAPAAWSFGPLMRFVAGAGFAACELTHSIVADRRIASLRSSVAVTRSVNKATATIAAAENSTLKQTGAIVMGADYRALGIARSLGRHQIPVWVAKDPDHALAASSKYVQRTLRPPFGKSQERLQFFLSLSAAHSLRNWLLFPTDDEAVSFVSHHHQELSSAFKLTTPDWEGIKWACNKRLMHCLANKLGLSQPWTFCPDNRKDVENLSCPFPSILKPALKDEANALTIAKAWRVDNHEQLLKAYDRASGFMSPSRLMIQEMIPGGGENQFSYAALCRQGEPLVFLTARRTRQYPAILVERVRM